MARVRLFGQARLEAGGPREDVDGATVAEVLAALRHRHGAGFAAVLPSCAIFVNGEPCERDEQVGAEDEIAVLPPVSGGAGWS